MKKYKKYRILRRDGACFYRAYIFRLFEKFIQSGTSTPELQKAAQKIREGEKFMTENGFDKIVIEDFCDLALTTLKRAIAQEIDQESLYKSFIQIGIISG
jgi:ubiquitin thioesterase protein OTUB1